MATTQTQMEGKLKASKKTRLGLDKAQYAAWRANRQANNPPPPPTGQNPTGQNPTGQNPPAMPRNSQRLLNQNGTPPAQNGTPPAQNGTPPAQNGTPPPPPGQNPTQPPPPLPQSSQQLLNRAGTPPPQNQTGTPPQNQTGTPPTQNQNQVQTAPPPRETHRWGGIYTPSNQGKAGPEGERQLVAKWTNALQNALQRGLELAQTHPNVCLEPFKNFLIDTIAADAAYNSQHKPKRLSTDYDAPSCVAYLRDVQALYDVANSQGLSDTIKATILPDYCYAAVQAVVTYHRLLEDNLRGNLADQSIMDDYAEVATAVQGEYIDKILQAAKLLNVAKGVRHFFGMGHDSAGGAASQLTIHAKTGTAMGQHQHENLYFRPEAEKLEQGSIHDTAGLDTGKPSEYRLAKRETAFYVLSEYLKTGLAVPTREGTRTDNGQTKKGAILDQAKGRTAYDYNYRYMGIEDYKTKPENGPEQTHKGGELIYDPETGEDATLEERMTKSNATFAPSVSNLSYQQGLLNEKKVKGGTVNALDYNFLRDLNRLNLLDILAGHPDRHLDNFLIETDESAVEDGMAKYKRMTAIDNDAVFGSKNEFSKHAGMHANNQTGIAVGMIMDAELADRICYTAENPSILWTLFQYLLSTEEIAALTKRFKQLSEIIEANRKRQQDTGEKLLLTANDWKTANMEELVQREMSLSKGWGAHKKKVRDENGSLEDKNGKYHLERDQSSANSYISRFMFLQQVHHELESETKAGLEAEKAAAEEKLRNNDPSVSLDAKDESLAFKAFVADVCTSDGNLQKMLTAVISADPARKDLKDEAMKDARNQEEKRLRALQKQYEGKLMALLFANGLEAVLGTVDAMGLTPEEKAEAKQRISYFYKKTVTPQAAKHGYHGRQWQYGAINPNIY